jgi:hypothetical protein
LLLLHYAGESGFDRTELGRHARWSPASVTRALQQLSSPDVRQIVLVDQRFVLTDLGNKRIREQLADKLLLT